MSTLLATWRTPEAARQRRLYAPFWVCLTLGLWIVGENVGRPVLGAAGVVALIPAVLMAGVGVALLFLRRADKSACLMALYLMMLGVLARGNLSGLDQHPAFATGSLSLHSTDFHLSQLAWVLLLGILPYLFSLDYTTASTQKNPFQNPLTLVVLFALDIAQAVCGLLAWEGIPALDASLHSLRSPYHRLLIYSLPVIAAAQGAAFWRMWRYCRQWGDGRNRALARFFGLAALFVVCNLFNDLKPSLSGWLITYILSYLVPLLLVYAVEKYALFDIQVTIRRVVQYAFARQVLTAMMLAPVLALAYQMGLSQYTVSGRPLALSATQRFLVENSPLIYAFLTGIFALLLGLRGPLLHWFDRTYFREVYDAQRALNAVGRSLLGLTDLREIARTALEGIDGVLHPQNLLLIAEEKEGVVCLARREHRERPSPLPLDAALLTAPGLLPLPPTDPVPPTPGSVWRASLPLPARSLLKDNAIRLVVPLTEGDRITAVLLLGEKRSGLPYTPEDEEVLRAVAAQIGLALQSARLSREFLKRRTRELTEGSVGFVELVEQERRLLAADLHDQTLPELRCLLTDLESQIDRQPSPVDGNPSETEQRRAAEKMAEQLRQTIQNIRDIMESLRPSALEMLGLLPALESELRKAASHCRPPLIPQFQPMADAMPEGLNPFVEMSVFRIVQEAITNACRHAGARTIRVQIGQGEEEWFVRVDDDGAGLPPEAERLQGHGLDNMHYRAGLIGARLTWGVPDWGQGTRVELRIPLSPSSPSA